MIPKIIHHMAPEDKSKWPILWEKCQLSVLREFSNFQYEFWTHERTDDFIKKEFRNYYYWWKNIPLEIIKIDLARLLIIYKYGGIYIDMDVYCYKNFYDQLTKDICIVATYAQTTEWDPCENFLFAGSKEHFFFLTCFEYGIFKLLNYTKEDLHTSSSNGDEILPKINVHAVNTICGNTHMSQMYKLYKNKLDIQLLDFTLFNQNYMSYQSDIYTKHMSTNFWGKEYIDCVTNLDENYKDLKKIPVDLETFDFYKNYEHTDYYSVFPNLVTCNFNIFTNNEKKQIVENKFLDSVKLDKLNTCLENYTNKFQCGKISIVDQSHAVIQPLENLTETFENNFIAGLLFPDQHTGYIDLILHNTNEFIFGFSDNLVNKGFELSKYCYGIFKIPIATGSFHMFPSWLRFSLFNKNPDPKTVILVRIEFDN